MDLFELANLLPEGSFIFLCSLTFGKKNGRDWHGVNLKSDHDHNQQARKEASKRVGDN